MPEISIITPIFNGARFLRACIESVLSQEIPIDHVFVDGGSTDGTLPMLAEYAEQFPDHVRFITGKDRGACDAWNKGWAIARGEVLGWLGADDVMMPGAARVVADHFDRHPDDFFVYGETNIIDEVGSVIGRYATSDYRVEDAIGAGNGVPAMAAYYRRALVDEIGPLDTTLNLCDCDYWIRAGKRYRLVRLPTTLAGFRMHGVNVTGRLQQSVYPREEFHISRRYGGGFFTPLAFRYYRSVFGRLPMIGSLLDALAARRQIHDDARALFFRRVAIFGAALSGQKCFRMLADRGIEVSCFLDRHPPPGGRFLDRAVTEPAGWSDRGVDAVYIASAGRHAEMRKVLDAAGWRGAVVEYRG